MLEEHCQITCLVLECVHQHQLYLKLEKSEMDPVKVAGVAEWLEPQNKKEVQVFLGFANFYWRFIQDFLHHAHSLFNLMGKDVIWSWGPPEQMAFDTLKHAVTSEPVLLFLDNNSPFYVETNSSNFATGMMLSQQSLEDRKWHPVAFYSKSLNVVEQNYKIHDKEMLAIIWSFEEWQYFLEGVQHKFGSLYSANFDFSLHHKLGQSMGKPDALSQRADHGMGEGDNSNIMLFHPELFAIQAMESLAIDGAEADILWYIQQGNRDSQWEELVAQAAQMLKFGHTIGIKAVCTDEWALQDGILTF
ncbi:hypothetical protein E4T56_gene3486 [Termitomyces sp. T112]|nr:hypothetical protein E4T56_gene3486 [Termitomyces sp. T112]